MPEAGDTGWIYLEVSGVWLILKAVRDDVIKERAKETRQDPPKTAGDEQWGWRLKLALNQSSPE